MLTEKQVFLLNQLNYCDKSYLSTSMEGSSVRTMVTALQKAYSGSGNADMQETFRQILSDNTLCGMTVEKVSFDGLEGMSAARGEAIEGKATSMVFTGDTGGGDYEGVVTFQGSDSGADWRDNFTLASKSDAPDGVSSPIQESALQYYQSPEMQAILSQCNTVTVTGHSKGGNNANYIALLDSSVSRSVTFDAPGFSDGFLQYYSSQIANRQGVLDNYSCSRDFVNILLNSVGEQHFYPTPDVSFANAHQPGNFLPYQLVPGEETAQDPGVQALSEMFNSYIRSADPDTVKGALAAVGELFGAQRDGEPMLTYLFEGGNAGQLADLIGFAIVYMQENPGKLKDLLGTIKQGHPVVGRIVEFAIEHPKMFAALVAGLTAAAGTLTGGALYAAVAALLAKFGLSFAMEGGSLSGLIAMLMGIAGSMERWKQAFAEGRVASGEDRQVSAGADPGRTLRWDTDAIRALSSHLSSLSRELSGLSGQVNGLADKCGDFHFIVNLTLRLAFMLQSGFSIADTPAGVLRKIKNAMNSCSGELDTLVKRLASVADMMEATERDLTAGFAGKSSGVEAGMV